jgi:hypothetical protein
MHTSDGRTRCSGVQGAEEIGGDLVGDLRSTYKPKRNSRRKRKRCWREGVGSGWCLREEEEEEEPRRDHPHSSSL